MSDIINDYFRITGRPISTMTVSEYLDFMRYSANGIDSSNESLNISVQNNAVAKTEAKKPVPAKTEQRIITPANAGNALEMLKSVKG